MAISQTHLSNCTLSASNKGSYKIREAYMR